MSFPRQGIPVVLVDRGTGGDWCSVGVDDVEGGELAAAHLFEQGHERIAFVGGPMSTVQVADRLQGTRKALRAAKRPADAAHRAGDGGAEHRRGSTSR